MPVADLGTQEEFEDYTKSKELAVVHFYAPWAEQCSQINDVLEDMSGLEEYRSARFAKVEAEKVPKVSVRTGVSAVPTVLLMKNETVVDRIDGAHPAALAEKIKKHLRAADRSLDDVPLPQENLESRLKKLIGQAPCVLFMKGSPANPRCGFSRTMVALLDSYEADYRTFDILQDNAVREGLKKFSNWPTYPQLYVDGTLVGGLDIVKEMSETGELESMLPKKAQLSK